MEKNIPLRKILSAVNAAMRVHWQDVIKKEYKDKKQGDDHYSFGLCYVASEAVMYLCREFNDLNFKPCVGRIKGNSHWWLENKDTGKRVDPTKAQFKGPALRDALYAVGHGNGFLTNVPSKGSQILIDHARVILQ